METSWALFKRAMIFVLQLVGHYFYSVHSVLSFGCHSPFGGSWCPFCWVYHTLKCWRSDSSLVAALWGVYKCSIRVCCTEWINWIEWKGMNGYIYNFCSPKGEEQGTATQLGSLKSGYQTEGWLWWLGVCVQVSRHSDTHREVHEKCTRSASPILEMMGEVTIFHMPGIMGPWMSEWVSEYIVLQAKLDAHNQKCLVCIVTDDLLSTNNFKLTGLVWFHFISINIWLNRCWH